MEQDTLCLCCFQSHQGSSVYLEPKGHKLRRPRGQAARRHKQRDPAGLGPSRALARGKGAAAITLKPRAAKQEGGPSAARSCFSRTDENGAVT